MTNTTTKKSAVKGTVAAAAGIAVLLGGAGTFALWNANGAIGSASTSTGHLTASIGTAEWTDTTTGDPIEDISTFHLVPGDTLEGTATVTVDAKGDNLKVNPTIDVADGAQMPPSVDASVTLAGVPEGGALTEGTHELTATIDLTFDGGATGDMDAPIDLSQINVGIEQVALTPAS